MTLNRLNAVLIAIVLVLSLVDAAFFSRGRTTTMWVIWAILQPFLVWALVSQVRLSRRRHS
jgi:hypothetical protein